MIRKVEADERRPSRELAELLAAMLSVPVAEREDFLRCRRGVAAVEELSITDQLLVRCLRPARLPTSLRR